MELNQPVSRILKTYSLSVAVVLLLISYPSKFRAQTFVDVADSLGVSAIPMSLQYGSGVSFYDFNEDGWDDLSFVMVNDSNVFYINNGGTFEKLPSFIDGPGQTKHLVWVDYDNDGDLDIAVTTFEGRYKLYQNDGNFNFTDVSEQAGLIQANERHYGITFGDYDRDGYLDMYVTVYEQLGTPEQNWTRLNHLYRNNGDGTFTNVTEEAGVGDGIRLSFKGVWMDYDNDGWPDLFVINDRVYKNSLYRNNGDGTFTDVSVEAGIELGGQDPMTATVGDFDNDGDLDIYMTNTNSPLKRGMLLVNNGDGTFSQLAEDYGVDVFGWTWGAIWIDYDNDTDQDLYVAHGHPNLGITNNPNFLLENFDGLFFEEVTEQEMAGPDIKKSYGVARGDINNDGYYDIAVINRNPDDVQLWQNAGGANNHIKITLTGTASNRMAIGSWIKVFINGNQYTQYTLCGENYISQNSQHHIFGLADAEIVDSVWVEYNRGHIDKYYNLAANQHYYFTEGDTYLASLEVQGSTTICAGDSVTLHAGNHESYLWSTGDTTQYIVVSQPGTYFAQVTNAFHVQTATDTVEVILAPDPEIDFNATHPLCHNDSNGSITLENLVGAEAAEVNWSNGMTGVMIDSLAGGVYDFEFVDVIGCSASGSVLLQNPLPLSVQVFVFPETAGNDGGFNLIINGGVPPYFVYLDSMLVQPIMDDLSSGVYQLIVVDTNGCSFEVELQIGDLVSTDGHNHDIWAIYPNPAKSGAPLFIRTKNSGTITLTIIDANGRQIYRNKKTALYTGQIHLNVPALSPGIYYVNVLDDSGALSSQRLIITH